MKVIALFIDGAAWSATNYNRSECYASDGGYPFAWQKLR